MFKRLILLTAALLMALAVFSSRDPAVAAGEEVQFIWPPTQACPGPDDESTWQCFNVKENGEDIAIEAQATNAVEPFLGIHATMLDIEARLTCGGTPLTVNAEGELTEWFTFTLGYWVDIPISGSGVAIPNSEGEFTGQLLACDAWPHVVNIATGPGHPIRLKLETRNGSSFDVALLIPLHWADGDYDDDRIPGNDGVPSDPPPPIGCGKLFEDVSCDHTFAASIQWLADEGITLGCNPPSNTKYCPSDFVTRGQMAAFFVRALSLPAYNGPDRFIDDDGVFEGAIERLAQSGITLGCNPPSNTRYCPSDFVTRGQMAAFFKRALG